MNVGIIGAGALGRALGSIIKSNASVFYASVDKPLPSQPYTAVFLCVPVQALRAVVKQYKNTLRDTRIVQCGKGISKERRQLPIEVVQEIVHTDYCHYAALIGPSFTAELGTKGQLTAFSVGDKCGECFKVVTKLLRHPNISLERTTDPKALELAGALKNVYAILFGYLEGAGYGENTRAAMFVRVLREYEDLMRTNKLNGDPLHYGVLGDLVLCTTSKTSRNYAFGFALARARKKDIPKLLEGKTVEGYHTALAIARSKKFGKFARLAGVLVNTGKEGQVIARKHVGIPKG